MEDNDDRREYLSSIESNKKRIVKEEKKFDQPKLPNEFISLSEDSSSPYMRMAKSYLSSRGVERSDILRWKLGYCEDGKYNNRVVFPSFDEFGYLNFFSARSFVDDPTRYKTGRFSKDIIFNDYMIDWNDSVTLVEGPFDGIKAGKNAIVLQGSSLNSNNELFKKLVLSGVNIFFALDDDKAGKHWFGMAKKLVSYGSKCLKIDTNGFKDVGEMTKEEFQSRKDKASPVYSSEDFLRMRIRNWV